MNRGIGLAFILESAIVVDTRLRWRLSFRTNCSDDSMSAFLYFRGFTIVVVVEISENTSYNREAPLVSLVDRFDPSSLLTADLINGQWRMAEVAELGASGTIWY